MGALPILLQALLRRRHRGANAPPNLLLREQGAAALHPVGPGSAGRRAGQENAPLAGDPGEHLLVLGRRVGVPGQGGSSAPGALSSQPRAETAAPPEGGACARFCRALPWWPRSMPRTRRRCRDACHPAPAARSAPWSAASRAGSRSKAWIRLRSSQLRTAALRGGSRCSPTPARRCSSEPGARLSGKVRIRCGWSPEARRARGTKLRGVRRCRASARHDQGAASAGGRRRRHLEDLAAQGHWLPGVPAARMRPARAPAASCAPARADAPRRSAARSLAPVACVVAAPGRLPPPRASLSPPASSRAARFCPVNNVLFETLH